MGEKVLKAGFLSQQKNYTGIIIFHTPNQKAKKRINLAKQERKKSVHSFQFVSGFFVGSVIVFGPELN